MPRAMWKGTISFGLVTIPVSLFTEVSANELSFHLLDSRDFAPVKNKRVNENTGEEVPWDVIVKGYELEDGRWITVTDEDFAAANVKATRTIDVLSAVCADDIPVEYFDAPYVLQPEPQGMKAYALLREALKKSGRVAIGQIVIRSRQRLCALVPQKDCITLEILRYPYELRDMNGLELPGSDLKDVGVSEAESKLAEQLIATIESDWDPSHYKDTYHDDLLALIERKAKGETITPPPPEAAPTAEVVDIMDLLKKSVEDARKNKPAEKRAARA